MKPEETNQESQDNTLTPGEYFVGEGSDNSSQHDQLQWLAFCYLADELTASQRADFEGRLSSELSVQEALASVVELSSGVHQNLRNVDCAKDSMVLERAGNRSSVFGRSSTLSRMLLIAATVLVLAFLGYGVSQNTDRSTAHKNLDEQNIVSNFSADEWINSFDEIDDDQLTLTVTEEDVPVAEASEEANLGLDPMLISFYSEVFDGQQEEKDL